MQRTYSTRDLHRNQKKHSFKKSASTYRERKWRDLRVTFPSCMIFWLRGCELQVHPKIEPQKQQDWKMGVPNLRRDAPSRSSRSLWSSQVLWGSQLPGVNEKVATSDRTPSVMTARLEYLWEIMDHGKKKGSPGEMDITKCKFSKICLYNIDIQYNIIIICIIICFIMQHFCR